MTTWGQLGLWLCIIVPCVAQQNASRTIFEFRSGFWVNLHHYLYQQALAEPAPGPLPPWREALDYYRESVTPQVLLNAASARANLILSQFEDRPSMQGSGLPDGLIAALERVAPDYRENVWPEHDRRNRAWISAATALLARHQSEMEQALVRAYGAEWPGLPIRTDVAVYANWAGAYTTLEPTHITISSEDPAYRGNAALEMLFHEASHALIGKVRGALAAAVRSENKLYRAADLWHAVLFYTAGDAVSRRIQGYTPYALAQGLYTGRWDGLHEILSSDWKPYLDGDIDLDEAARRLAASFGVAAEGER